MDDIVISQKEAVEYAEFKRQKRIAEVCRLLKKVECDLTEVDGELLKKRALACRDGGFGYIRVNPLQLCEVKPLVSPFPIVCGTEEVDSALKTKITAVRCAVRGGADEIVASLASFADEGYLRKEFRRLKRAAAGRKIYFRAGRADLGKQAAEFADTNFVTDESQVRSVKELGSGTVTAEGVFSAQECRRVLSEGADRICTADYARLAEELFAEANRPEVIGREAEE